MHVICGRIYIKLKQTRPIDHFICDIRIFPSLISEILNSILRIVLRKKPFFGKLFKLLGYNYSKKRCVEKLVLHYALMSKDTSACANEEKKTVSV